MNCLWLIVYINKCQSQFNLSSSAQDITVFTNLQELKKLLNIKLKLGSNKIKPPQKQSSWVFVTFRSEEDRDQALKVIHGMKWKNQTLSATVSIM